MGNGGALSAQGVVIFGGATLRMDVDGTMNQGMELYGTGVGGTHGALEVSPGVNFGINGDCLLDTATTINVASGGLLAARRRSFRQRTFDEDRFGHPHPIWHLREYLYWRHFGQ